MTGHPVDLGAPAIGPEEFGRALSSRNEAFRTRILQVMLLGALVLRPLPREVALRLEGFATGNSASATGCWRWPGATPTAPSGWRRITEFYRARGFAYPGSPGSVPPLLAQHDWVHVLADYGTTVESELEVLAFIARANDDPQAFSLLAMVVSLFETGYLRTGAGLFESFPGQLSRDGVAVGLADAMRRGAIVDGSIDFMGTDRFEVAHLGVQPKSPAALAAGSASPWGAGGISEFQDRSGRASAERHGWGYDAFGATP